MYFSLLCVYVCVFHFIFESEGERHRVWAGEEQRDGDRIQSRFQAPRFQHRAWRGARSHEQWDHDLSQKNQVGCCSTDWATQAPPDIIYLLLRFYLVLRERERQSTSGGRGRERMRHRIRSRLQALSCQHRVRCGTWTHERWDHDLSPSWTLNRLSHSGVPEIFFFFNLEELGAFWGRESTAFNRVSKEIVNSSRADTMIPI